VIGTIAVIIPILPAATLVVHLRVIIECCAAVRGSTSIMTSALPIATGTFLRIRTSTSVFVAPAHNDFGVLCSDLLKRGLGAMPPAI